MAQTKPNQVTKQAFALKKKVLKNVVQPNSSYFLKKLTDMH
jgi:hypothetical protein